MRPTDAIQARRSVKRFTDRAVTREEIETLLAEHRALPAMIAVAVALNENPEIREEDYAAAMMAVQNIALAAVELGLGTHIKSGAVMDDPAARATVGLPEGQRLG